MTTTAVPTLDDDQYRRIAQLAQQRWGLHLHDGKRDLVASRIHKHLRRLQIDDLDEYLAYLEREAGEQDLLVFFDLLSTNTTSFFRERGAFDYLERELYTALDRGNLTLPQQKLRIWSAACSNGAEAYSLAMHAREHLRSIDRYDVRILATDLSTSVLREAKRGVYPLQSVHDLDPALCRRHLLRGTGPREGLVMVKPEVKRMVHVARLNLMDDWPFQGPFDVIFCRNVMIYFDRPTRARLVGRLYEMLRAGGVLAIGSAETLSGVGVPLRQVQPSVYRK